jgi:hypothetical protein
VWLLNGTTLKGMMFIFSTVVNKKKFIAPVAVLFRHALYVWSNRIIINFHPSIHPTNHLSVCLSIYLSPTYLRIYLPIYPSIHP